MAQPAPPAKKRRLGEILLDAGLIDESQLQAALAEQRKWGGKLGRTLVEMGFVEEESMLLVLSRQLNVPAVDLDRATLPPDVGRLMRLDLAEQLGVFPLGGDPLQKTLLVATSDPTNQEMLQELAARTGRRIQWAVAGRSSIDRAIRRYYYGESHPLTPTSPDHEEPTRDLGTGQAGPAAPPVASLEERLGELSERVALLEKQAANQSRALRGLFELLVEKGVMTRTEYLEKIRKG